MNEPTPKRTLAAQLHRIAAEHAGGLREGLSREGALAELAAVSTDPDLLAEAAAAHAIADEWYVIGAVALLIVAGADQSRIDAYAEMLGDTGVGPEGEERVGRGPGSEQPGSEQAGSEQAGSGQPGSDAPRPERPGMGAPGMEAPWCGEAESLDRF